MWCWAQGGELNEEKNTQRNKLSHSKLYPRQEHLLPPYRSFKPCHVILDCEEMKQIVLRNAEEAYNMNNARTSQYDRTVQSPTKVKSK